MYGILTFNFCFAFLVIWWDNPSDWCPIRSSDSLLLERALAAGTRLQLTGTVRLGPDRFHGYKYTGYVLCFDGVIFGLEIVRFRHKSGLFITPSIMTTEDTKTYLAKREIPQLFEVSRHVVTTFKVSAHLPWCATMLLSDWSMNAPATDK